MRARRKLLSGRAGRSQLQRIFKKRDCGWRSVPHPPTDRRLNTSAAASGQVFCSRRNVGTGLAAPARLELLTLGPRAVCYDARAVTWACLSEGRGGRAFAPNHRSSTPLAGPPAIERLSLFGMKPHEKSNKLRPAKSRSPVPKNSPPAWMTRKARGRIRSPHRLATATP